MSGIGALRGALTHQPGLLEPGQREVEEEVGAVALDETVTEVRQHAEWKIPQVTGMLARSLARA
ncbi:hypothetical protein [Streptomyces sp. NPDC002402]